MWVSWEWVSEGVGLAFADRRILCSTFLNSLVSFERRSISSFPSLNPDRTLNQYKLSLASFNAIEIL